MKRTRTCKFWRLAILAGVVGWTCSSLGQQTEEATAASSGNSAAEPVRELRQELRELQAAVAELRAESAHYRAETAELRKELEALRAGAQSSTTELQQASLLQTDQYGDSTPAGDRSPQVVEKQTQKSASLQEQYELLSGKVDDQYQTKVESASKYRMRLSGIVLLNLFSNIGTVDNIDFPALAYERPAAASGGSFGATLRQSQVGFEVFGPQVAGARTTADLQLDLAGGFARMPNGINAGILRLRTGTLRLDWAKTSIVAGQDRLFFSPTSPTSFASLAVPALSYAGNLWGWIPQVRVEHKFSVGEESSLLLQGGVLDAVSGEAPLSGFYRQPQAGEMSRVPAFGTRAAWTHNIFGLPLRIGAGGYYSRQAYGFGRNVDAWAGMADWELPFGRQFSLSGKLYRGRALGGIGGGLGRSVLFKGDPTRPDTQVVALNDVGGWAQLKYKPVSKLEFNAAFGQDNPYKADVAAAFPGAQAYGDPTLVKNQEGFFNLIYRPRSDLLFSAEYRHITNYTIDNGNYGAHHLNLSMGVLF